MMVSNQLVYFFFSSRRRHTICSRDWSSDVCSSDLDIAAMRGARDERYLRMLEQELITIAGARETLAALRPHFVMGIVTSSRRADFEAIHRRTGLLEFFDFALT